MVAKIKTVENLLEHGDETLSALQQLKRYSRVDINNDFLVRGALERYLFLLCQSAIDIAEAVVSLKDLGKPQTQSEAFELLYDAGIIERELSEELIKMVGFRNVLSHRYLTLNYDVVYDALHNKTADVSSFFEIIRARF